MTHLETAANSLTARPSVARGATELEFFSTAPGVIIYPTEGSTRRDGQKVARTPGTPYGIRYRLFDGQMEYAVRFLARDDVQLTGMLEQFLEYLFAHRLHDQNENFIAVPSGPIRLAWRDPEGALMGDHTVELSIPASASLYSDRERHLINIVVTHELASTLEGIENG